MSLQNFGTVTRDVLVNTGTNVNLSFGLKVAGIAETVTVTDETPVVGTKKVGTSTTVTERRVGLYDTAGASESVPIRGRARFTLRPE